MTRNWGPKVCFRCSQYGHSTHECKFPIDVPPPPEPKKEEPEEQEGWYYMGLFVKGKKPDYFI